MCAAPALVSVGDDGVLNAEVSAPLSDAWIDRDLGWLRYRTASNGASYRFWDVGIPHMIATKARLPTPESDSMAARKSPSCSQACMALFCTIR